VEIVDGLIKQLAAQLSLETVDVALHFSVSYIVLRALCLFSRIAALLDLRRVLLRDTLVVAS
jgi:hypothetical protein